MKNLRFIHMSDLHYRKNYADCGFEALIAAKQHPQDNVIKCLRKEKSEGLDFVLITGDLTHEGETEDYIALHRLLKAELGEIPFILLPGNHDRPDAYKAAFGQDTTEEAVDSIYDLKGLKIITLDTGRSINGEITESQTEWLSEVLKQPSERGYLLALHHPLIDNQDGLPPALHPDSFTELIKNSDILGIFCGHTHHNYIAQFAGKPYFTADSMAFSMVSSEDMLTFKDCAAYTVMKLSDRILSAGVRQVVPAVADIASFSSDKLSQLFSE